MNQERKEVPFPSLTSEQVGVVYNIVSELPYKHVGQIIEMIKNEALIQSSKQEQAPKEGPTDAPVVNLNKVD